MGKLGRRSAPRWLFVGVLATSLAGCDVGQVYRSPVFPFASSFEAAKSGNPVLLENVAWWESFNDPVLDDLVSKALRQNLDLVAARERVREAEALVGTVRTNVSVSGDAQARYEGYDLSPGDVTDRGIETSLGFDWLIDPWGELDAERRAARGRVDVAQAELDAARLLMLSGLATTYIDYRFYQRSLALRYEELESRRKTVDILQTLAERGAATRLDVARAEALVSETRALIPGTDAAAKVQAHRLAVYLAKRPGELGNLLKGAGRGQPVARMAPDTGIPADLLRNRPDIQVAERLYYVDVEDITAERARLYPSLSISGVLTLSSLGTSGSEYLFGPTLRLPALPDGPQKSRVAAREASAREALTVWQSTVLDAIEEVESALVQYAASRKSVGEARKTVALYQEIVSLNQELIGNEGATVRDLIDAEQQVATANVLLAQNLRQLGENFVTLNVALGAGATYEEPIVSVELAADSPET